MRGQARAPASCALRPRLWTPSYLPESCTRDSSPVPGAGRALEGRVRALACWGVRAAGPARAVGGGCGGAAEELSLVLTLICGPPAAAPICKVWGPISPCAPCGVPSHLHQLVYVSLMFGLGGTVVAWLWTVQPWGRSLVLLVSGVTDSRAFKADLKMKGKDVHRHSTPQMLDKCSHLFPFSGSVSCITGGQCIFSVLDWLVTEACD